MCNVWLHRGMLIAYAESVFIAPASPWQWQGGHKSVAKSNISTLHPERLSEPSHGVKDNARENHESSNDYDKQHKDSWAIRHTAVGVETLHDIRGQCEADADEEKSRRREGKQGLIEFDVAQNSHEDF